MSYSFRGSDERSGETVADEAIEEAPFGISGEQIAIEISRHGEVAVKGAATKFEFQSAGSGIVSSGRQSGRIQKCSVHPCNPTPYWHAGGKSDGKGFG
jgi:hypothetical protein